MDWPSKNGNVRQRAKEECTEKPVFTPAKLFKEFVRDKKNVKLRKSVGSSALRFFVTHGKFLSFHVQGCYSEKGFHIGMYRNFVCLWRRHNCRSQLIDLSLSELISCL
jgi:hypothetical protein